MKVTAVENSHYRLREESSEPRRFSFSYRFETPDRSIVFTGDTGPSAAVEALAEGVDILVAEMASATDIAAMPAFIREHMLREHLTATELGKLAQKANVQIVVVSHVREVVAEDAVEIARYFDGRVVLGEDLERF